MFAAQWQCTSHQVNLVSQATMPLSECTSSESNNGPACRVRICSSAIKRIEETAAHCGIVEIEIGEVVVASPPRR
jgi:hypothetical protein